MSYSERPMDEQGITLSIILEHLRAFETRMLGKLQAVDGRMGLLESRIDKLGNRMDRMECNLTAQIDAIDKRLDEVEIEYLPKRVSRIERHLKLAPIA